MGGFPSECANTGYGPANICKCTIPDPPPPALVQQAPAQTTVNVSPNIAVSPQISPNFVQQFQPSGSPVTAGTMQSGSGGASSAQPSAPVSSGPTQADIQAQIDAALALERANRAASVGTVIPQNSAGVPSPAVPAYTPPAYSGGDPVGGAITYAGTPATSTAVAVPESTTPPDRTMLYAGLGAAALLLFLLSKPRRA